MTIKNINAFRNNAMRKNIKPLSSLEIAIIDDPILKDKSIIRLNDINMAVDFKLKEDYVHNRFIHSMQVANIIKIMTAYLSEKLGFEIDPRGIFKYAGVFHDIGHTSFGHQGEEELNRFLRAKGISYDGNANNYVALKKSLVLSVFEKEDREYILASLAKHFEDLYPEQESEKKIILENIVKDEIFLKDNGIEAYLTQTLACMVMDIADEIAYLITDLMDAMNVVSIDEMKKGIQKFCSVDVQNNLIPALEKGKSEFRAALNSYTLIFATNFDLVNGKIVYEDKEIEDIRTAFRKINVNLVLKSNKVIKLQKKNKKIFKVVFDFFIENEYQLKDIPSSYYKAKLEVCNDETKRLMLVRDMLGALTDKGLIKIYRKIIRKDI